MLGQATVWSEEAELVRQARKELRAEKNQDLADINLVRVNTICDKLLDIVFKRIEGENSQPSLRGELELFKREVLQDKLLQLRTSASKPTDQYLAEVQTFKMLLLKGIFDSEAAVQCMDTIVDRFRSNKEALSSSLKSKEISDLRKENALLKQTTDFQREEIDFLKRKNTFEERRVSFDRIMSQPPSNPNISKTPSFDEKGASIETISKVPTPSRQNQRRTDITKLPKGTVALKPVIGKCANSSRKNSLTTLKNESINEKLLPQLGDDLIGLLAENRDLKNKIEKLSSDLKYTDSRLQDLVAERHHTVSLMSTDNACLVEALKRQLAEIKESHSQEKSLLAKRMEEEATRSKKRIHEMESNFAQKAAMISQETENRYIEMSSTLKSALETTSYELKETQNKLKDLTDLKRLESVRYESRIQDLKNELRKSEAKFETLKRKFKEEQTFQVEIGGQKLSGQSQARRISDLLSSVRSDSRFENEYLKTEHLMSTDGPDISELTSAKRLTFADDLKAAVPNIDYETEESKHLSVKKDFARDRDQSLDFISSSPNLKLIAGGSGSKKLFGHKPSSKRLPLNIKVSDEDLLTQSHKIDRFRSLQDSKEDLLHSDIVKYFNNNSKAPKPAKKPALFDLTASASSLKQADSSFQNAYSSYATKKYDMSPSSVSKPLDYFIKKKQSLQTPI
jgi:hypothetical protein